LSLRAQPVDRLEDVGDLAHAYDGSRDPAGTGS
jgi:hypothetical protein